MEQIRLDKFLAGAGIGTRSEVKNLIKKGRVTLQGEVIRKADLKLVQESSLVCVDGKPVSYTDFEYYLLHKPAGCVSATKDHHDQTVLDLIDSERKQELFPVGRLDKDTEGLLLITNDGALAHELLSPRKHIEKTYYAQIAGVVTTAEVQRFLEGLDIGEAKLTLPATLEILKSDTVSEVYVTVCEGKFHQIKRMFAAVGQQVLYLRRISMGPLTLEESLQKGCFRPLTEEELERLKG